METSLKWPENKLDDNIDPLTIDIIWDKFSDKYNRMNAQFNQY